MIYLIASSCVDWNSGETKTIFKIGYTGDSKETYTSRMREYKTHNPSSILLGTIERATLKDETKIHRLFNWCKLPNEREWFFDVPDIATFFCLYNTKELLDIVLEKDNDSILMSLGGNYLLNHESYKITEKAKIENKLNYNRQYYKDNREKCLQTAAEYRINNRNEILRKKREYGRSERVKKLRREKYQENRAEIRRKRKEYYQANREKIQAQSRESYYRRKNVN